MARRQEFKKKGVEASYASKDVLLGSELSRRDFELVGKKWSFGDKLNRGDFAWLHFEPAWESVVMAREIGDCTKAAIELKQNTAYSSDRRAEAEARLRILNVAANGSDSRATESEKVYLIQVEFRPMESSPEK